MREQNRRGVVLVELITATGVVFLLVALQLQAIQNAREAARRAQCVNNLKQIGVANLNYSSANDTFPMSAVMGDKGHGVGHGCFTALLPYLEHVPVYNTYNFSLENWHTANKTSVVTRIDSYLCPSNINRELTDAKDIRTHHDKPYPGELKFAPLHYGANWGGVREASGAEAAKAYPGSHLGVILTVVDPDAKVKTKNITLNEITDGTSFTLAFVEKRASFGWGVGGWGGSEFDVFTSPFYMGDDIKLQRAFTGSFHPEIVNVAYCDGSVRAITPDVDRKLWYALTTRAMAEKIKAVP